MSVYLDDGDVRVLHGDCITVMRELDSESIDAVCTDPPYALSFMGREWDTHASPLAFQLWCQQWAAECLRVLKPGGHLVAFSGTRTAHRMVCGIEDAGFEIRDTLAWLYGSGFPKSLDVSKAIDKLDATAERDANGEPTTWSETLPHTAEAAAWQGWGTALKPAHEPITLARKPLRGTVAGNVLEHGTGALNIDACRIEGDVPTTTQGVSRATATGDAIYGNGRGMRDEPMQSNPHAAGRWPANVILDDQSARLLDQQTGDRPGFSGGGTKGAGFRSEYVNGESLDRELPAQLYGDRGGASRFFYTAKASGSERNDGLHGPASEVHRYGTGIGGSETSRHVGAMERNTHPTVKPVDLMRWLIRLLAPPGALILDPFAGSGTTGVAARAEQVRCILIEREAEYLPIIAGRLSQQALF